MRHYVTGVYVLYLFFGFLYSVVCVSSESAADNGVQPSLSLEESVINAHRASSTTSNYHPVAILEGRALRLEMEPTLGAALQNQMGVHNQSFGPSAGRPVIRGQSGSRVQVMQNGLGSGDMSHLSPDHAITVEPVQAEKIEILRGPETLLYGSGAMGGIINVIDRRIPTSLPTSHVVEGMFESRYDSALEQTSTALSINGGKGPLAAHLDGFYRDSGNMNIGGWAIDPQLVTTPVSHNTYGFVPNTYANTLGGAMGLSWVEGQNFIGTAVDNVRNRYGIPPNGSDDAPVRINLTQMRYDVRGRVHQPFRGLDALTGRFSYVDYNHTEMEGGMRATEWRQPSYEGRLEYTHSPFGTINGTGGVHWIRRNSEIEGEEAVLPSSRSETYSSFALESFDIGPIRYQLGMRIEYTEHVPDKGEVRHFLPVSGGIAARWSQEAHQVKVSFTHLQRVPSTQELYMYGIHHATGSFEVGDPHLDKETSYLVDFGYQFHSNWVKINLDVFYNDVNKYIYQRNTGNIYEEDSDYHPHNRGFPVFYTSQDDAIFTGFESTVDIPLMDNQYGFLDLTLFSDYTHGKLSKGGYVPRMPPLRYGFQFDYTMNTHWSGMLRLTRVEQQDHFGQNESKTPGYVRLDLGMRYETRILHGARLLFFMQGKNLLNENIRQSVSYLRGFSPEPGIAAEVGLTVSY